MRHSFAIQCILQLTFLTRKAARARNPHLFVTELNQRPTCLFHRPALSSFTRVVCDQAPQAKNPQRLEAYDICQKQIFMLQQIHKYIHLHTYTHLCLLAISQPKMPLGVFHTSLLPSASLGARKLSFAYYKALWHQLQQYALGKSLLDRGQFFSD